MLNLTVVTSMKYEHDLWELAGSFAKLEINLITKSTTVILATATSGLFADYLLYRTSAIIESPVLMKRHS